MNPNDPSVALLERAAEQLGEALLEQLVFVGGVVAGVLITDPAMPEIRPTQDVDVICRAAPAGRDPGNGQPMETVPQRRHGAGLNHATHRQRLAEACR